MENNEPWFQLDINNLPPPGLYEASCPPDPDHGEECCLLDFIYVSDHELKSIIFVEQADYGDKSQLWTIEDQNTAKDWYIRRSDRELSFTFRRKMS
jgi:hypothetical protein